MEKRNSDIPATPTPELKSSRLLAVDDEVELLTTLVDMLKEEGYETAGVISGKEALDKLQEQEFDILLTDLMMPQMDGIELLKASLKIDPNLVGIIMTGHGTIQTAVDAMKYGAFDYILKPFKLRDLLSVLHRAMEVRRLKLENLQLRETLALYELSKAITFTLDLKTILNKVADAALQQCDADELSIMLPTRKGDELYVTIARGDRPEDILGKRVPIGQGIAGWVALYKEALALHGEVNDPRFTPVKPRSEISSAISLPLVAGGKLVGVLNANSTRRRRRFTLGQMKALSILCSHAAAVLESSNLYNQVQEAEEKYRSIFNNAMEGIFQTNVEGRIITANPAMSRILRYDSPEDLMGNVAEFRNLFVDQQKYDEFQRFLEEKNVIHNREYQIFQKDGNPIWVSLNVHAVRDGRGIICCHEGTFEDVTERYVMQERLQQSEGKFRELFHRAPVGYHELDSQGRITRTNQTECILLGCTEEEMLGKHVWDFYVEKELSRKEFEAKISGIMPLRAAYERTLIRKDGTRVPVLVKNQYLFDDEGKISGLLTTTQDITELKKAEEALKESEGRYRALFQASPDGILIADIETREFKYANPALCRMLGYSEEDIEGMGVKDIHPEDALERVIPEFEAQAQGRKIEATDIPCLRKDGTIFYADISTTRVLIDNRECNLGFFRDTTERKKAEEEKRALEVQFLQAQKMEAVGTLAGGVAHDFNNLMTVIMGSAQLASMNVPSDSQVAGDLEEIRKAAERASILTRQLLAFARRQILQKEPLNLNDIITNLEKMLSRLIGERIAITMKLAQDIEMVMADAAQIEQIVMNLVVNARDAMPDGGTLILETANMEIEEAYAKKRLYVKPGYYVLLAISDTGCGMTAEVQDRIFEPFFTTKAVHKGTGLGLSTVYGIVKQHDGYIWVYSEVDKGTTFRIYLPVSFASEPRADKQALSKAILQGTETILIVEDEEGVRNIAQRVLSSSGYTVLASANGKEALSAMESHPAPIDLLITDIVMPDMTGFELARNAAAVQPGLKVLFISGYSDEALNQHGEIPLGCFLQKPFSPNQIAQKVREVLDRKE